MSSKYENIEALTNPSNADDLAEAKKMTDEELKDVKEKGMMIGEEGKKICDTLVKIVMDSKIYKIGPNGTSLMMAEITKAAFQDAVTEVYRQVKEIEDAQLLQTLNPNPDKEDN